MAKLEELIKGYMSEMQSPNLPDALKGKEKIIFGNIKSLLAFHKEIFLEALEQGKESMDAVVQCFIDHVSLFNTLFQTPFDIVRRWPPLGSEVRNT